MRTAAALLVLVLLLFLNPAVVAAAPPAARMDLAVLLWESAGAVPFAAGGAFSDVARNDDGATAAAWCREAGLLLGTGDGRFSPDRPLTREELAVALRRYARILGRDTFLPAGAAECNDYADIGGKTYIINYLDLAPELTQSLAAFREGVNATGAKTVPKE